VQIENYHAYRIINPPADGKAGALFLPIPRAPTRMLRFVDPNGHAIQGVTVHGLVAPPLEWRLKFDGSEAEVVGLEPGKTREVIANSNDHKYAAMALIGLSDPNPMMMRLEPTGSISGRLVDESSGRALAGYTVSLACEKHGIPYPTEIIKTDADGRFSIRELVPDIELSISIQEPLAKGQFGQPKTCRPESLRHVVPRSGSVCKLDDIRIKTAGE
jgi:hypothetical protein